MGADAQRAEPVHEAHGGVDVARYGPAPAEVVAVDRRRAQKHEHLEVGLHSRAQRQLFKPVLILAYPREPPAHGGWLPRHLPRRPSQHDPNFFRPSVARAATKSRRNISSRRDMLYILAALLEGPKV